MKALKSNVCNQEGATLCHYPLDASADSVPPQPGAFKLPTLKCHRDKPSGALESEWPIPRPGRDVRHTAHVANRARHDAVHRSIMRAVQKAKSIDLVRGISEKDPHALAVVSRNAK